MTADTPIYIASVTKLYTAATVMLLVERGELALADPVAKFLPATLLRGINSFGGEDHSGEIAIADLLSHRSGIADYYTEPAADGKSLADWLRSDPDRQWTVDETIARSRDDLKPHSLPGTATFYSDANFQLLGKVIETVTGKPLDAVFDEVLFRPLGLDHTWLVGHPRPGVAETTPADVFHNDQDITRSRANRAYWADGAVVSTAGDMIAFLRALNGGRIVSRQTLALMHQWQSLEFPLKYGYGTMYFSLPWPADKFLNYPPLWGHSGSTGSFLYYAPDLDLYMAGTIDQTEAKTKPFILMARVMKAIRSDPAFRLPPASGGTSS
jgi:CubicO group peptidase (beta-lactamase class C family)